MAEAPLAEHGHEHVHPPPPQPWLQTLPADLASLVVWIGPGTALAALVPLPTPKLVVPLLGALAGLWGVGVERGWARRASWPLSVALAAWAAAVHGLTCLAFPAASDTLLPLWARLALIAGLGSLIPRAATHLDRKETAWRAALRCGPPEGSIELSHAIGAWRPPAPLSWLLLLLWPLDMALRLASLGAILLYQLTASRLMPSACMYEPSCSRYGFLAYLRHAFPKACILTALRILRCSPLGSGGYDPIPGPPRSGAARESNSNPSERSHTP